MTPTALGPLVHSFFADGLLTTRDGGTTWQRLRPQGYENLNAVFLADSSHWVAVTFFGRALHTTDGGASWSPLRTGTRVHLNGGFFRGAIGTLVGEGGTILRTTDGGATWNSQ